MCLKSVRPVRTPSGSRTSGTEQPGRTIDIRIRRLSLGNPGGVKPAGEGISELRVDHGPGYRVYFIQKADVYIVLLAGGDKSSQEKDIRNARALAREL